MIKRWSIQNKIFERKEKDRRMHVMSYLRHRGLSKIKYVKPHKIIFKRLYCVLFNLLSLTLWPTMTFISLRK